jgi:DNA-binding Xre family transcriptional regulator
MKSIKIPIRYLPLRLTKKDKHLQLNMLKKSRKLYKKNKYYTRKQVKSYTSKPSKHIINARKIYKVDTIIPNKRLARATGCSINALNKIVQKGKGAYFSSGSRPNQTAQSWGLARLASSITGGKAAAIDFNILEQGCKHNKKAFLLAKKSKRKYGFGHSKTKKILV